MHARPFVRHGAAGYEVGQGFAFEAASSTFLSPTQLFTAIENTSIKMPSALILLADGSEETEFVTTYDILVRAGIHTKSCGVNLKSDYAV